MQTVHSFEVKTTDGSNKSLEEYDGKVLLIVNTASRCGLAPQFQGLQELYDKHQQEGFEVLGFPSDQFNQEFDNIEETLAVCETYRVAFPMFAKINVNGENTHPLYKFLKSEKGGVLSEDIKWNFTKFLVDQDGKVVKRYAPTTAPDKIEADIAQLLG